MANLKDVKPKPVLITLNDGIEREIKFTLNSMAAIEDAYGNVNDAFKALDKGSMKAVRCVIWAGLIWNDETLTQQQVGNMLDIQTINNLSGSLSKALDNDMPGKKKENKEKAGIQDPNV